MFKNAKRTVKNDVVSGTSKRLSLQNITAVLSALMAILYFFSFIVIDVGFFLGGEKYKLSGFSLTFAPSKLEEAGLNIDGAGVFFSVFFLMFLIPAVIFLLYFLNTRRFNQRRSFGMVMGQYIVAAMGGLLLFLMLAAFSVIAKISQGTVAVTLSGRLYQLANIALIVTAVIGIVKTGGMPIDYEAETAELISKDTVEKASAIAGGLGKKAAAMAESAEKKATELAASAKETGERAANAEAGTENSDKIKCPSCGKLNKMTVNFCTDCGQSLKEAKAEALRRLEAEKERVELLRAEKEREARERAERERAEREKAELLKAENEIKEETAKKENAEVRFCENCGAKLAPGAAFCESCGKKVN